MKIKEFVKKIPYSTDIINRIRSTQIPESTVVFGNKIYLQKLGLLSWELAKQGIYEKEETHFVMNQIKENDVVLDIGANIGYYTILFAKLVGNKGKVFAFEPEKENFNLLNKNIEINNYKNVQTENVALSNANGKIKLYLSNKGAGQHKIYRSNSVTENFQIINTIKLDDYFQENSMRENISFIKMDTEGSELGVLNGMTNILKMNKKLKILLEFDLKLIADFGANPKEIIDFLSEHEFNFSLINKQNNKIEHVNESDLLFNKIEKSIYSPNLICIRN